MLHLPASMTVRLLQPTGVRLPVKVAQDESLTLRGAYREQLRHNEVHSVFATDKLMRDDSADEHADDQSEQRW